MSNATGKFSVKLNLNNNKEATDDEELDISMVCCDQILDVFRNNNVNMYESSLILNSLADAINVFLLYGDELENILEK